MYEMKERDEQIIISNNGVESREYAVREYDGRYAIYEPVRTCTAPDLAAARRYLERRLGVWLNVDQARDMLASVIEPVSNSMFCRWLTAGRFPGAKKIRAAGRGGSWRIPLRTVEEMIDDHDNAGAQ